MTDLEYNFQIEVFKSITKAFEMFNITTIDPEDVIVRLDIRGKCAGQAIRRRRFGETEYTLRFNMEAITKYWDEQVNSTIPHEVAHLVCMIRPELGKNHDAGWRRVAIALGDVNAAERTHSMLLSAGKAKTEYMYNVNGNTVMLGPKHHKNTQTGQTTYTHRSYGKIERDMFVKKVVTRPGQSPVTAAPAAKKPVPSTPRQTSSTNLSKREQAEALYKAMTFRNEGRPAIIEAFMSQVGLTKAGANTYYYNCQKKFS